MSRLFIRLVALVSGVSVVMASAGAIAGTPKSRVIYNTPADDDLGAPKTTAGAGSRGCESTLSQPLTLMAPSGHTGKTVSARPTFVWSVPEAKRIEFSLVEPGVATPLYTQQMTASKSGLMAMTLPASAPELQVGKEYRWSVTLVCNAKRRSADIYAQAWIQRVADASLNPTTLSTLSLRDRVQAYATAGIWYDALALAATPNSGEAQELLNTLLEQVGLTKIASQR